MAFIANSTVQIPLSEIPTPLVFATPRQALSHNIAVNIHVGSTSVLIWDIMNNINSDIRLIRRCGSWRSRLALPNILYFTTRATLLAYSLGKAVLLTAPIDDCAGLERSLNGVLIVFVSSTTLLFYIRVSALYAFNKHVMAFFGVLWLATFAMTITFLDTFYADNIGPTRYCTTKIHGRFLGPSAIVLLVNEVLTYLAVTYRMYQLFSKSREVSLRRKMDFVVFGASLPALGKAILQQNQLYCLAIVSSKAFLLVINYTVHGFDPPASVLFIISHLVIVNILGCRIYRDLKRGNGLENTTKTLPTELLSHVSKPQQYPNEPISFRVSLSRTDSSRTHLSRPYTLHTPVENGEKSLAPLHHKHMPLNVNDSSKTSKTPLPHKDDVP